MDEIFDMPLPGLDWIAAVPACICNPFKVKNYPKDWYVRERMQTAGLMALS